MIIEEEIRKFRDATMLMQGHTNTLEEKVRLDDLESSDRKFEFRATKKEPDAVLNIREGAALINVDMSTFAREAVAAALERVRSGLPIRGIQVTADTGTDALRLPAINSIPCGPLSEAYAEASDFVVNAAVALELELFEGDYWTRADGDSMQGEGIADGVRVAVRPYNDKAPRKNEIVIVQIEAADGSRMGTIKKYVGQDEAGRPRFVDGEGTPYPLPNDCQSVEMPARVISVLGRVA